MPVIRALLDDAVDVAGRSLVVGGGRVSVVTIGLQVACDGGADRS
jgi:hypothetical protein